MKTTQKKTSAARFPRVEISPGTTLLTIHLGEHERYRIRTSRIESVCVSRAREENDVEVDIMFHQHQFTFTLPILDAAAVEASIGGGSC